MSVALPKAGIYPNVPEAIYRQWPAWCQSTLKRGRICAKAMKDAYDREGDDEPTEAMKRGTAVGRAVLEPERGVVYWCGGPRRSKAKKAEWAQFVKDHPGSLILDEREEGLIAAMTEAVWAHEKSGELLKGADGMNEVSGVWTDPKSKQPCKMRCDRLTVHRNDTATVLEIKKVGGSKEPGSAHPDRMPYYIDRFDVHVQGAMYRRGVKAIFPNVLDVSFGIFAVEEAWPHLVSFNWLNELALQQGDEEVAKALELARKCRRSGVWPAYDDGASIGLPAFRMSGDLITVDGEDAYGA